MIIKFWRVGHSNQLSQFMRTNPTVTHAQLFRTGNSTTTRPCILCGELKQKRIISANVNVELLWKRHAHNSLVMSSWLGKPSLDMSKTSSRGKSKSSKLYSSGSTSLSNSKNDIDRSSTSSDSDDIVDQDRQEKLEGQAQETNDNADLKPVIKHLTQRQKLAKVFAEYGTTAIAFHATISLTSLGLCYLAVSSGFDVDVVLQKVGLSSTVASGASTFVVAYAIQKMFMPVRIFLTLTCTPIIVRKLRSIGFLKIPTQKEK